MHFLGNLLIFFAFIGKFVGSHPDENLSVIQLIKKHNYPVETHTFETEDGYILSAQRIPHGVSSNKSKHVALLAHGMGGGAENYITLGPPDALAFYLADRGYDVWLFNARGTLHSRKHKTLNPNRDRKKFWDFSWHEIAIYDLPTTIDYVLNATDAKQLFYVGHSQGTTTLFVMLSELPEFNDKIKVAGVLAPAELIYFTQSPIIVMLIRILPLLQRLFAMFNWHEMAIPNSPMLNSVALALCKAPAMQDLCLDILYAVGGPESGLIDKALLPIILKYSPSGFAVRQMVHYAQIIKSGEFKRYDFGKKKNFRLYNESKPPMYNLSNAKIPLALFYSVEDPFGNYKMVEEMVKSLPNVVLKYEIPIPNWNHIDFVFAYNLKEVIHDPLYEVFKQFENDNNVQIT